MQPVHDDATYRIIGAAMQVHRTLGPGFLEAVYQEALALEFEAQAIAFAREVLLPIHYRGRRLGTPYRIDFVCFGNVVVELKAHSGLGPADVAQAVHYLRGSDLPTGLLLNFGKPSLEVRRLSNHNLSTKSV